MAYDLNSRNHITLVGNVGQDLEVREHNGRKIVNMNVATNEGFTPAEGGERVERPVWHRVTAYGPIAERLIKGGIKQGSRVYVEGRMSYDIQEKEIDGKMHHFSNPSVEVEFSLNLTPKPTE